MEKVGVSHHLLLVLITLPIFHREVRQLMEELSPMSSHLASILYQRGRAHLLEESAIL